ncbi:MULTISPECIES: flagellar basal body L-ring protein FlgH [Pseudoxanthomonas]|uniref:flagellar basal body L-ring protein FlgH n=1 Tax=Pseudoxanthomonas TaxID=83618 RepID=UPI0027D7DDA2|nr:MULTISPECIES: flagellar basal body L-ring protein FlgH [Pseudoxanthomonas]
MINADSYRGIAADHRAYRIGDVLTVNVLEAASAKSSAATDATGNVGVGGAYSSPGYNGKASLGLNGDQSAGGQTSRAGELRARLSVGVVGIEANGLLRVQGAQSLLINGENQNVTLTGLVRPEDIDSSNAVWSHRIADAKLELNGVGVVNESQRQSIIFRALKWLRLI